MPQSIPCGCPETVATDDCPQLTADITRVGSLYNTPTVTLACGVDTIPSIAMTCNSARSVTIAFTPTGAVGSAIFVSLTPHIVTVEPGLDDTKNATLTAHANGSGLVHVYADGSPYTFPVAVSACP